MTARTVGSTVLRRAKKIRVSFEKGKPIQNIICGDHLPASEKCLLFSNKKAHGHSKVHFRKRLRYGEADCAKQGSRKN